MSFKPQVLQELLYCRIVKAARQDHVVYEVWTKPNWGHPVEICQTEKEALRKAKSIESWEGDVGMACRYYWGEKPQRRIMGTKKILYFSPNILVKQYVDFRGRTRYQLRRPRKRNVEGAVIDIVDDAEEAIKRASSCDKHNGDYAAAKHSRWST